MRLDLSCLSEAAQELCRQESGDFLIHCASEAALPPDEQEQYRLRAAFEAGWVSAFKGCAEAMSDA